MRLLQHPVRLQPYLASGGMAAAAVHPVEGDVPLLVRVLAGNPVTSAHILACLNTDDARHLRQLNPSVSGAVADVPWRDTDTPVVNPVRWHTGLPSAVGARLAPSAGGESLTSEPAVAALGGITHLNLNECSFVTDELLLRLPTSLRTLTVRSCRTLTARASFAHLTALTSLDCSMTCVVRTQTDGLPPSLQELDTSGERVPRGVSFAHLRQLRVLRACSSRLDDVTLASLPPSLEELYASNCNELTPTASFAHLTALRMLDISHSTIGDASLATLPLSLMFLNAYLCYMLTPAAALPHLPALQRLDMSATDIGDALVSSLPASLTELRLVRCCRVTAGASLDYLHSLRALHCIGTGLAPAALTGCRARGCAVPAADVLRGHHFLVIGLALLGYGRLASLDSGGVVRLWDVTAGGEAIAVLTESDMEVHRLAALPDGRHLAIGTASHTGSCVQVWDVGGVSPVRRATINCHSDVRALEALADGRLAAGCDDGKVLVIGEDESAVVATLSGHSLGVTALAVLHDGTLASGSWDKTVRLWDVGARACVATLVGHTDEVRLLAVLANGRLARGVDYDGAARLWDVGARACVGVLGGHTHGIDALAALPDGRLASGSSDGTIRLWDTRPAAATGASRAAGAVPVEVVGVWSGGLGSLLSLPDGRLAFGGCGQICLLGLPPPAAYN